jgi:phosphoserine aminotransferase
VDISCRSRVNIPFFLKDSSLNDNFVEGAMKRGLINLKGHPVLGGIRASVYNGMPMKGVLNLLDWMSTFEKEYCYEAQ